MRSLLMVLVLLVSALSYAQGSEETYGKTEADILAMGQKKWYDFYVSKAGDTTVGMSAAYHIYYEVAKKRNDKMPQTATLRKLAQLLGEYGETSLDLAENLAGGGTIWIPMRAQAEAGSQDVMYPVLGGTAEAVKPAKVSMVRGALAKLHEVIMAAHADKTNTYVNYGRAQKDFATLEADFRKIQEIAKGLSRANSDRVLGYCRDLAVTATADLT